MHHGRPVGADHDLGSNLEFRVSATSWRILGVLEKPSGKAEIDPQRTRFAECSLRK